MIVGTAAMETGAGARRVVVAGRPIGTAAGRTHRPAGPSTVFLHASNQAHGIDNRATDPRLGSIGSAALRKEAMKCILFR